MEQIIIKPFELSILEYCRSIYSKSRSGHIKENTFFNLWFRTYGTPYTFVFKKNLKVTNIQYAELIALIRSHSANKIGTKYNIQFINVNEFIEKFTLLFNNVLCY